MQWLDALDDTGAVMAFWLIVISGWTLLLAAVLCGILSIGAAWRFLVRHTWGSVIASLQRRVFRR